MNIITATLATMAIKGSKPNYPLLWSVGPNERTALGRISMLMS